LWVGSDRYSSPPATHCHAYVVDTHSDAAAPFAHANGYSRITDYYAGYYSGSSTPADHSHSDRDA